LSSFWSLKGPQLYKKQNKKNITNIIVLNFSQASLFILSKQTFIFTSLFMQVVIFDFPKFLGFCWLQKGTAVTESP